MLLIVLWPFESEGRDWRLLVEGSYYICHGLPVQNPNSVYIHLYTRFYILSTSLFLYFQGPMERKIINVIQCYIIYKFKAGLAGLLQKRYARDMHTDSVPHRKVIQLRGLW